LAARRVAAGGRCACAALFVLFSSLGFAGLIYNETRMQTKGAGATATRLD